MFKGLYDRIIALSQSPRAPYALAAIAFAESSVFPIPPDVHPRADVARRAEEGLELSR